MLGKHSTHLPSQSCFINLSFSSLLNLRAGNIAQLVDSLSSFEALNSISRTAKTSSGRHVVHNEVGQKDRKFKVILNYVVSSRLAWTT